MKETKTPHETSWLFLTVFLLSSIVFGWFIVFSGRGVELVYDETDATEQRRFEAGVQKIDIVNGQSLYIPSLESFRQNQPWMYVGKSTALPRDYTPRELIDITLPRADREISMQLRKDVHTALERLFAAATKEEYDLMVSSGYRSITDQQELFDNFARTRSEAVAKEYVLAPGTSEHHTGYAVDITDSSVACEKDSDDCNLSPSTAEWIASHAADYGFIVRYPGGKEPVTGIAHEPWHLRYVGVVLARQLTSGDIAFDEFIEQIAPGRIR